MIKMRERVPDVQQQAREACVHEGQLGFYLGEGKCQDMHMRR